MGWRRCFSIFDVNELSNDEMGFMSISPHSDIRQTWVVVASAPGGGLISYTIHALSSHPHSRQRLRAHQPEMPAAKHSILDFATTIGVVIRRAFPHRSRRDRRIPMRRYSRLQNGHLSSHSSWPHDNLSRMSITTFAYHAGRQYACFGLHSESA